MIKSNSFFWFISLIMFKNVNENTFQHWSLHKKNIFICIWECWLKMDLASKQKNKNNTWENTGRYISSKSNIFSLQQNYFWQCCIAASRRMRGVCHDHRNKVRSNALILNRQINIQLKKFAPTVCGKFLLFNHILLYLLRAKQTYVCIMLPAFKCILLLSLITYICVSHRAARLS